jgi:Flp pilus assembly protein TadD
MQLHGARRRPANTDKVRRELQYGVSLLSKVVQVDPGNWSAYWIMGKAYQAFGNSESACAAFGESFAIQKENPDVAREYMFESLNLGRAAEGVRAAEHAVNLRPEDGGLLANLAMAYLIAGRNSDALDFVNKALQIAPNDRITQEVKRIIIQVRDGKRPQPTTTHDL